MNGAQCRLNIFGMLQTIKARRNIKFVIELQALIIGTDKMSVFTAEVFLC